MITWALGERIARVISKTRDHHKTPLPRKCDSPADTGTGALTCTTRPTISQRFTPAKSDWPCSTCVCAHKHPSSTSPVEGHKGAAGSGSRV